MGILAKRLTVARREDRMSPHMMDFPLLLSTLYEQAVGNHPGREIVSVEPDGSVYRSTYAGADRRIRRLVAALEGLGIGAGDVIATLGWNTHRHHEIYWATANTGRVCHTVNLRLSEAHLRYIVDHGQSQVMFISGDMVDVAERLAPELEHVKYWIMLDGDPEQSDLPGVLSYEDLIADTGFAGGWPELDERSPHMYCYTSGTTGAPKGVAYTQRSTYMHTVSALASFPWSAHDNIMPVVPMFHAAGWGHPFMATTVGAKITYPGQDLTPEALVDLIEEERVTISAGVPTVWMAVQAFLQTHTDRDISSLRYLICGGSAVPRALIDWYEQERGVRMVQSWGMTETNPLCTFAFAGPEIEVQPWEQQLDTLETAGRLIPGLRAKIVDDEGRELPRDGEASGELLVQGPWIAARYIRDERSSDTMVDGWLRTGDVCRITPEGYIRITDRAKDVIKSGGEWISSIDLENFIMAHPEVAEAAVVGVPHREWQERPIALVVRRPGVRVGGDDLSSHLRPLVVPWWLPDAYFFVEEIPKTSTGKFDKKEIRAHYAEVLTSGDSSGTPMGVAESGGQPKQ